MGGSCSGGAPPSTIGKHERGVAVGGPKAHNVQVRLPKQLSTAVIGLEHAGKSTVLHTLARRRTLRIQQSGANLVSTPPPTVASRSVKVDLDAFVLKAVDTPGRDSLRATWPAAMKGIDFLILVVDATQPHMLTLARAALDSVICIAPPRVLVLATKADLPGACGLLEVADGLQLRSLDTAIYWAVEVCSNVDDAELKNARDLRHAIIRFASEVRGRASGS